MTPPFPGLSVFLALAGFACLQNFPRVQNPWNGRRQKCCQETTFKGETILCGKNATKEVKMRSEIGGGVVEEVAISLCLDCSGGLTWSAWEPSRWPIQRCHPVIMTCHHDMPSCQGVCFKPWHDAQSEHIKDLSVKGKM